MKLITLIASHLDGQPRLHHFIKLIKSINEQIDYYDEMDIRISMSIDKTMNSDDIMVLLNTTNPFNFKIHYQQEHLSQFEHYKFLCSQLDEYDAEDTWILFSDDDDEWAQNRMAAYHYMINYVAQRESSQDTSSICYTNDKTKTSSTYIGNYIDYCVKIKYLRIFFSIATDAQLKHKYGDCYFVRFMCTYGAGKLKKAFCATDDILYHWIKRENSEKVQFEDAVRNNLDLYMAQYTKPNASDWLRFCFLYCDEKIKGGHISDQAKKFIVKLFLNNYENHLFNVNINDEHNAFVLECKHEEPCHCHHCD